MFYHDYNLDLIVNVDVDLTEDFHVMHFHKQIDITVVN